MHTYTFFLKSIQYIIYMSYPQTHRAYFSNSYSLWCSYAKVISLSYTRTHTDTHTNTIPSSKSVFSTAHFLPPLLQKWQWQIFPLTRKEKEQIYRVESQNWVQIILLCQGSLDFFLPDLTFGVYLQDTNFALFLPFNTGLTHFAIYFGCAHGLLDIVLLAGWFLWADTSLVYTSPQVIVSTFDRLQIAAALNNLSFKFQSVCQDDGHVVTFTYNVW